MRSGGLNFSARKIEKEWLLYDVIYDFLLHVSGQIDTAVKGENQFPTFYNRYLAARRMGNLSPAHVPRKSSYPSSKIEIPPSPLAFT